MENVKLGCDNNPACFGFTWNKKAANSPIGICRGREMRKSMEDKDNEWTTQLKSLKRNQIVNKYFISYKIK